MTDKLDAFYEFGFTLGEAEKEKLPCPFCGGEAVQSEAAPYFVVWCVKCEITKREGVYDDVIATWNVRVKQ